MKGGASRNAVVSRVVRLDGSTRIVRVLRNPMLGWEAPAQRRLTAAVVVAMQAQGVRVVLLRRGLLKAEVPTIWLVSARPEPSPMLLDRVAAVYAS